MTTPRSVLVVSNHGEIAGGGEVSLLALLKALDRSRWAPTVVVPCEGAVANRCRTLGLPTRAIQMPGLRFPAPTILRSVVALRRLAGEAGAALLHANGSRAMFYAGLAGCLARQPVIWHVRVADPEPRFDRVLLALAQAVIVNSTAVARRFSYVSGTKVHVIHNGVDLARFSPRQPPAELRSSFAIPAGARIVGSVGRFVPYKGYSDLLDAARLIEDALPGTHWILVGDGEQRPALEAQIRRLGLQEQVHFTGWREEVSEILPLYDVFVLPSLGEHFGRVLIEAMAMAKPVVATDAGGVPEVVIHGETGLLVPPAQPKDIAEAVVSLLEDRHRAHRFGMAGRQRAETLFSLSRHVEAIETLYREVLGMRHGIL